MPNADDLEDFQHFGPQYRRRGPANAMRRHWKLVGIEFHRRYREGGTWLDHAGGNHYLSHYMWVTLEFRR